MDETREFTQNKVKRKTRKELLITKSFAHLLTHVIEVVRRRHIMHRLLLHGTIVVVNFLLLHHYYVGGGQKMVCKERRRRKGEFSIYCCN